MVYYAQNYFDVSLLIGMDDRWGWLSIGVINEYFVPNRLRELFLNT